MFDFSRRKARYILRDSRGTRGSTFASEFSMFKAHKRILIYFRACKMDSFHRVFPLHPSNLLSSNALLLHCYIEMSECIAPWFPIGCWCCGYIHEQVYRLRHSLVILLEMPSRKFDMSTGSIWEASGPFFCVAELQVAKLYRKSLVKDSWLAESTF